MAVRKKLETAIQKGLVSTESKRGVHVNKAALTSLAQHSSPSKIYPFYVVFARNKVDDDFDLPDVLPDLPLGEEVAQVPNLLDVERWISSIDSIEDAMFAAQIRNIIFSRLPQSYKAKAAEVV